MNQTTTVSVLLSITNLKSNGIGYMIILLIAVLCICNRNLGHGRGRKTCELNLSQSQNHTTTVMSVLLSITNLKSNGIGYMIIL